MSGQNSDSHGLSKENLSPRTTDSPNPDNETGVPLFDLLRDSVRFRRDVVDLAKQVRIDTWAPYTRGHTLITTTVTHSGSKHGQIIDNHVPNSSILKGNLTVTCSCQDFQYRRDYALYAEGASPGVASRGIPSKIRNPRNTPILCKHLFRVLVIAREKARQGSF